MDELLKRIEALETRLKVLEDARSYKGCKIKNFYCNGYFGGQTFGLEGAEIVEDDALKITVRTEQGTYYTAHFDSLEEKQERLQEWMTESGYNDE